MGLLNGHRAVVTGGGSGIGAETCRRMAAEGAQVSVFDVNGDNAELVAKEIDGRAYAVDVTDFDALEAAMTSAAKTMGGLSLLYNNAGGSTLSPLHDYEVSEWRRIVDLNLTGVFHGFKAGAPLIRANGGGAIVSTASISGTRPAAGEAPYAAAKAAVVALTASAALEYAPTIRVNAVSPGMSARRSPNCCSISGASDSRINSASRLPSTGSARRATSPMSWCSCVRISLGS